MITRGTGFPVVIIPGIQGRWEWMTPTIDALAAGIASSPRRCSEMRPEMRRAMASSSLDARARPAVRQRPRAEGLAHRRVVRRPDRRPLRGAASRTRDVARACVHAAPSGARGRATNSACRFPWLALPYFRRRGCGRLGRKCIARAIPGRRDSVRHRTRAPRVRRRRSHRVRMAHWIREWQRYRHRARLQAHHRAHAHRHRRARPGPGRARRAPMEYLQLIPGATHTVLPGTGHVGIIARPYRFAEIAGPFIYGAHATDARRQPRGRPAGRRARPPCILISRVPPADSKPRSTSAPTDRRSRRRGLRPSASACTAARCTRRRCFRAPKASTRIGCAVLRFNFRGVGGSGGTFDQGDGEMADFQAALDFMAVALSRRRRSGRPGFRSDRGSRSKPDPTIRACPRSSASRRRSIATATRGRARSRPTKPKFLVQGDMDELCRIKDLWAFYAKLQGAEGDGRDRRRHASLRGQDEGGRRGARGSARRLRGLKWRDDRMTRAAVIVAAVRTAVGKAPNGALRYTRPDELAAVVLREALARVPARRSPPKIDDVIIGCAMPEAEQGLNVARIASLRAGAADQRVGGDGQSLLRVQPRSDRHGRRPHRDRRGRRRARRRHGIDEPRADGRQQDRAESASGRDLSGRVPRARDWSRRITRATVASRARRRTRSRCAAISARSRRRTMDGSRARSVASWHRGGRSVASIATRARAATRRLKRSRN